MGIFLKICSKIEISSYLERFELFLSDTYNKRFLLLSEPLLAEEDNGGLEHETHGVQLQALQQVPAIYVVQTATPDGPLGNGEFHI